jgi:hypothetical protein
MKIAVSPAQRLGIFNLTYAEGQKYKGQEARRFRRFCRHLGLEAIAVTARRDGKVSLQLAGDEAPRLFEVDAEDVARLARIDEEIERSGQQETVLGPLFDMAIELKAERPVDLPDVPEHDAKAEDWRAAEEKPHAPPKLEAV